MGPLGELLEPSGTLAFEDAVAEYARIVKAGEAAGADLIFFETYTDLYEWGLSGKPGSAERKARLLNALGLPPRCI